MSEAQINPPAETQPQQRWDGIIFNAGFGKGSSHRQRINDVCDKLEPLLKGGTCHFRDIGGGRFLATPGAGVDDKLNFLDGHPRAREPRFTWVDGPDGLKYGTLVEGA
jgi:hypothetical protein